MTEVQDCFSTISGYKYFTVLVWAHRAWIHVDVRIHLDDIYFKAACLKNCAERCGGNTLSEAGYHTTSHEHVMCQIVTP